MYQRGGELRAGAVDARLHRFAIAPVKHHTRRRTSVRAHPVEAALKGMGTKVTVR